MIAKCWSVVVEELVVLEVVEFSTVLVVLVVEFVVVVVVERANGTMTKIRNVNRVSSASICPL